ncbi:NAD(P)-dependent oxidoreductase [Kocuria sp. M1N1S27]|uniref:NAD(P)-dependent oxidoreductase n=1 Tax=Kocuria kalidii TaxID=3376283 RepID=UPI003796EC1E
MRIVVFGADTGLGREIVTELVHGGHTVTAVLPAHAPVPGQWRGRVVLHPGNALEAGALDDVIAGTEVVIDALGDCRGRRALSQAAAAATAITDSMVRLGCYRYIGLRPDVLLAPAGKRLSWGGALRLWQLRCGLRTREETAQAFTAVARSPLSWTILRCPGLIDGPARGIRHVAMTHRHRVGSSLTRADAARFLTTQLRHSRYVCAAPAISN